MGVPPMHSPLTITATLAAAPQRNTDTRNEVLPGVAPVSGNPSLRSVKKGRAVNKLIPTSQTTTQHLRQGVAQRKPSENRAANRTNRGDGCQRARIAGLAALPTRD